MEASLVALLLALAGLPALAQDAPPPSPVPPGLDRIPEALYPLTPVRGVLPGTDPFEWRPSPPVLQGAAQGQVELRLRVPPGYTVYRDQLVVRVVDPGRLLVGVPDIPPGVHRHDPARDVEVREQYDADIVVHIPVQATDATRRGLETFKVFVRHQGCYGGHCFRPVERFVNVHVPVRKGDPIDVEPADAEPFEPSSPTDTVPAPRFVVYVHGTASGW